MDREIFCTCCDRKLNPARIVSLELDRRINEYHNFGGVPESESQGWFDFGPACAAKKCKNARALLQNYDSEEARLCGEAAVALAQKGETP